MPISLRIPDCLRQDEKSAKNLNHWGFRPRSSSVQNANGINLQRLENSRQMASSCVCRRFEMITQKARYALRALAALAQADPGEPMMISEIAGQQAIPKKFLEQILLDLKHQGIVASRRGKAGGYLLLKPARDITYGEVLRIIDGPIAPLPCLSITAYRKCDDCDGEQTCEIRHVFAKVADATRKVLFSTTIADTVDLPVDAKVTRLLA
jgi:Rrf2 family protein